MVDVTLYVLERDAEKKVHVGRFHVPKVRNEQRLYFDFTQVASVTRCVFEYVASYGVYPCTVGTLALHC